MIKLIVGSDDLERYARWQAQEVMPYEDAPGGYAVPCVTRFMPKRADEILKTGGSLYRVMKSRIVCRSKIVGFEMVEIKGPHGSQGKKCLIMQDPEIITTVAQHHRPFQGWRYFDAGKAPADRGVYVMGESIDEPPDDMADELKEAGLL